MLDSAGFRSRFGRLYALFAAHSVEIRLQLLLKY